MEGKRHNLTTKIQLPEVMRSTPNSTPEVRSNEDPHSSWHQLSDRRALHLSLEGLITPQHGRTEARQQQTEEVERAPDEGQRRRRHTHQEQPQQWVRDGGRLWRRSSLTNHLDGGTTEDPDDLSQQCPLVVKGAGQHPLYVPWSFMDMAWQGDCLHSLTELTNG